MLVWVVLTEDIIIKGSNIMENYKSKICHILIKQELEHKGCYIKISACYIAIEMEEKENFGICCWAECACLCSSNQQKVSKSLGEGDGPTVAKSF